MEVRELQVVEQCEKGKWVREEREVELAEVVAAGSEVEKDVWLGAKEGLREQQRIREREQWLVWLAAGWSGEEDG
ncbi:hypothetical protein AMTR_s00065p00074110 [Amborella trichopoda]|uniref:Uncharacterized protein n=1 Tax=Amborella trichopoda TaxID=13333 RepID=U5CYZ3_AMBTC|nr:hypothetical protein AMTR_s00065p00074110 [Amborella trichopoda]